MIFVPTIKKKEEERFKSVHKDSQKVYGAATSLDSKASESFHRTINAKCC